MNKIGRCVDCSDVKEKPLIAGRCNQHYWKHRDKVNKEKRKGTVKEVTKQKSKDELTIFFDEQSKILPATCENCGDKLPRHIPFLVRSAICHIVPKRFFKSVQTNPLNVWFGCMKCHHDYDDRGWSFARQMKVWPLVVKRFLQFKDQIDVTEYKHLPDELKQHL